VRSPIPFGPLAVLTLRNFKDHVLYGQRPYDTTDGEMAQVEKAKNNDNTSVDVLLCSALEKALKRPRIA
jgi:hypothetical protein